MKCEYNNAKIYVIKNTKIHETNNLIPKLYYNNKFLSSAEGSYSDGGLVAAPGLTFDTKTGKISGTAKDVEVSSTTYTIAFIPTTSGYDSLTVDVTVEIGSSPKSVTMSSTVIVLMFLWELLYQQLRK